LSQETTALHADPHFMIILHYDLHLPALHSFPTRRSSDLLHYETATQEADEVARLVQERVAEGAWKYDDVAVLVRSNADADQFLRSEEHTSELQSRFDLVCRLLLEKKKTVAENRQGTAPTS